MALNTEQKEIFANPNAYAHGEAWLLMAAGAQSGDVTQFYHGIEAAAFAQSYDPEGALHPNGADYIDASPGSDIVFGGVVAA